MQCPIITLPEDIRNAHGIREEDNEKESGLIIEKRQIYMSIFGKF